MFCHYQLIAFILFVYAWNPALGLGFALLCYPKLQTVDQNHRENVSIQKQLSKMYCGQN